MMYRFEVTYVDDRGQFVQTDVVAEDESDATDKLWDEDYYYGGNLTSISQCEEVKDGEGIL